MIWPSKWRHLKGLSDIMALASFRRDDPRHYLTSPLFATEPLKHGLSAKFANGFANELYKTMLDQMDKTRHCRCKIRSGNYQKNPLGHPSSHFKSVMPRDERGRWVRLP